MQTPCYHKGGCIFLDLPRENNRNELTVYNVLKNVSYLP